MQRPAAPTISVVIPAYGHAHFIRQTLESVLGQTRPPSEVIVINDGSPDDTRGAVRPFMDRITYLEQENLGMVRTMNRARDLATGDYNFGVASDDWLEPDAGIGACREDCELAAWATGTAPEAETPGRPDSVSRFSRLRSARMSDAC